MEAFVRSFFDGHVLRRTAGGVVNGLEDVLVELSGLLRIEGVAHHDEGVGQALDTEADRSVAHVGVARLRNRVVVPVDDPVQVLGHLVGHLKEFVVVEVTLVGDEFGEGDGRQVADGHLVLGGVLDDLRAEVGAADGAEVLLVGLAVGCILVQHVRYAGLNLVFDNLEPELLGLDGLASLALGLVLLVQGLELRSPAVGQSRALVRAHQGPVSILLDALHEEVRCPEGVEQVAGALLLLSVVLLEVEEIENVGVPRLDVDSEGALAFAAALVHVAGCVIEDAEHRDNAVGRSVRAADVGTGGPDVVDGEADAAGVLGNLGALLQRVVDAANAVFLHGEEEAAGHLRLGCAGVEEGRGGVGKPALRHQVVGLDCALDVVLVDADGDAHEHVLRTLGDLAVELQQVRALERLEAEVVVVEVAVVDDGRIQLLGVGFDDLHDVLRH